MSDSGCLFNRRRLLLGSLLTEALVSPSTSPAGVGVVGVVGVVGIFVVVFVGVVGVVGVVPTTPPLKSPYVASFSCFRGALPPLEGRAVCFVRAPPRPILVWLVFLFLPLGIPQNKK